jgi:hypothetical protein
MVVALFDPLTSELCLLAQMLTERHESGPVESWSGTNRSCTRVSESRRDLVTRFDLPRILRLDTHQWARRYARDPGVIQGFLYRYDQEPMMVADSKVPHITDTPRWRNASLSLASSRRSLWRFPLTSPKLRLFVSHSTSLNPN